MDTDSVPLGMTNLVALDQPPVNLVQRVRSYRVQRSRRIGAMHRLDYPVQAKQTNEAPSNFHDYSTE